MRALSPIHETFPEARDLLAAVERYWGRNGWLRSERHPRVCFAACAGCKSKPLRREWVSAGYPLWVQEHEDGGYLFVALCACSEQEIVAALGPAIYFDLPAERAA